MTTLPGSMCWSAAAWSVGSLRVALIQSMMRWRSAAVGCVFFFLGGIFSSCRAVITFAAIFWLAKTRRKSCIHSTRNGVSVSASWQSVQ